MGWWAGGVWSVRGPVSCNPPPFQAVRATVDAIFPAISRVLAVSDPASSEAELRTLALQAAKGV